MKQIRKTEHPMGLVRNVLSTRVVRSLGSRPAGGQRCVEAMAHAFEAWLRASRAIGEAGLDGRPSHRASEFFFAGAVDVFGPHRAGRLGDDLVYYRGDRRRSRCNSSIVERVPASLQESGLPFEKRSKLKGYLRVRECSV
jgi:hypothetical protein